MTKVKVCILGTGTIANKLAQAFSITPEAELYAISSRNIEKALAFSEKYNIPKAYGSYEEALEDSNVNLIYIALPHPFHYTWAKKALLTGKNVLCEKPLTVNAKEAEELFTIVKEKGLFFSEAMWTRFLPSVKIVTDMVKRGTIGKITRIDAAISNYSKRINRMSDPNLAGGILLDCGVYLITSVFLLLGSNYSSLSTKAKLSKRGVDLHSKTMLTYPDGQKAKLTMAMDFPGKNQIIIKGEKGTIKIDSVYNWQNIRLKTQYGTTKIAIPKQTAGGFEYMTKKVCHGILLGKTCCKDVTAEDTLAVMHLMDTLRNNWDLKYPFEQ